MQSSHTRFSEKPFYSQLFYLLFYTFPVVSQFLFWSVGSRPLPVHPIVFRHPGMPVGRKHSVLQPWKWANKLDQRWQIPHNLKSL